VFFFSYSYSISSFFIDLPEDCVFEGDHYDLVDAKHKYFGVNLQRKKVMVEMKLLTSERTKELNLESDKQKKKRKK
jgi:hypothetical protein